MRQRGILGCRQKLAVHLLSKKHDIFIQILTVIFSIAVLLFLLLEDYNFNCVAQYHSNEPLTTNSTLNNDWHITVHVLEWILLFNLSFFLIDSMLHLISYGMIYIKSVLSSVFTLITITAIVFCTINIFAKGKIDPRGIFRVLIVAISLRKLQEFHLQRNPRRTLSRMKE